MAEERNEKEPTPWIASGSRLFAFVTGLDYTPAIDLSITSLLRLSLLHPPERKAVNFFELYVYRSLSIIELHSAVGKVITTNVRSYALRDLV